MPAQALFLYDEGCTRLFFIENGDTNLTSFLALIVSRGSWAIPIFDEAASNANETTRRKMLDALYKSSVLEWHFWNNADKKQNFDLIGAER